MMNIFSIVSDLENTSSRNDKIQILTSNSDNELLKKTFEYALNPLKTFFIKKLPPFTPTTDIDKTLEDGFELLDMLIERKITGNNAITNVIEFLSHVTDEDADIFCRILFKDMKCGVSISTVNKVWKCLVFDYPCMLASAYDKKLADKITYPAYCQQKLDGMRFNAIVCNNNVSFYSRNGHELSFCGELESEFISLANGESVVFDGELLVSIEGKIQDRQIGNGILLKANKGTLSLSEAKTIVAVLWDTIPLEEFKRLKCTIPYKERYSRLYKMLFNFGENERIKLVETHPVNDVEHAFLVFEYYISQGQEGIILKDLSGIWENKRSKSMVKFKGEFECDLVCTDTIEGNGKYAGMVGAIRLQSPDGKLSVDVGSGLTDLDRKTIDPVGKIVSIKYNAIIKDSDTGIYSLFLPRFIEVRQDKTESDTFEMINTEYRAVFGSNK